MNEQISKDHHYVPQFLLNQWAEKSEDGQIKLRGHYWDRWRGEMRVRESGSAGFCYQRDLFTIPDHHERDDAVERQFFEPIDTRAAAVHQAMLEQERYLTLEQRHHWMQFMLSLESRRPDLVMRIKTDAIPSLIADFDSDPEILAALQEAGIDQKASEFYFGETNAIVAETMSFIQRMTYSHKVAERLLRSRWAIKNLVGVSEKLVLSDRPLIRVNGLWSDAPLWALPLSPISCFLLSPNAETLRLAQSLPAKKFLVRCNESSVLQCDKYVFATRRENTAWLEKRLKDRFAAEKPHID